MEYAIFAYGVAAGIVSAVLVGLNALIVPLYNVTLSGLLMPLRMSLVEILRGIADQVPRLPNLFAEYWVWLMQDAALFPMRFAQGLHAWLVMVYAVLEQVVSIEWAKLGAKQE